MRQRDVKLVTQPNLQVIPTASQKMTADLHVVELPSASVVYRRNLRPEGQYLCNWMSLKCQQLRPPTDDVLLKYNNALGDGSPLYAKLSFKTNYIRIDRLEE